MKEPLSPGDTPEVYASHYLRNEEEVKLFEKVKEVHDYCQNNNLLCYLYVQYPSDGVISLYHITDKQNPKTNTEKSLARGRVDVLVDNFDSMIQYITFGYAAVTRRVKDFYSSHKDNYERK